MNATSISGSTTSQARPAPKDKRIAWRSGLAGLILQAAVVLAFVSMFLLAAALPSHMARQLERNSSLVAMALVLIFCGLGGALWARALARITGIPPQRRLAWAGAIAYGPPLIGVIFLLNEAEKYFLEGPGRILAPVHVVFAVLFTLAAAAMSALIGGALGLALREGRLAARLALYGGVAAGGAFLIADVLQDLLGRRVGGPNAAATATMLTVMLLGNIIASMSASAVIGIVLRQHVAGRRAAGPTSIDAQTMNRYDISN